MLDRAKVVKSRPRRTTGSASARADAVTTSCPVGRTDESAIASLSRIKPAPVLVVHGSMSESDDSAVARVASAVTAAIAAATARTHAIVVDAGLDAALLGRLEEQQERDLGILPVVVGVSSGPGLPAGCHTHIVCAGSGNTDAQMTQLFEAANALAGDYPVAMLLIGCDDGGVAQAAYGARRGWRIIAVDGGSRQVQLPDAMSGGDVRIVSVTEAPAELTRSLIWALNGDIVLQRVWRLFATYDAAAKQFRRTFARFQAAILLLGILAALFALLHRDVGSRLLHWVVVVVPLIVGALIALASRRAAGKRWVLMRGAAESVKSEIFSYRARAIAYVPESLRKHGKNRAEMLAERIGRIEKHLSRGEVGSGQLEPYEGPLPPAMHQAAEADDGLCDLTAKRYVELRVADQLRFYRARARKLERLQNMLQLLAIAASGAGALIAAAGAEPWVALTAAISAAPLAYAAHLQFDRTIIAYNHSAARLEDLERTWYAKGSPDSPEATNKLVKSVEAVLTSERGGWVAHMSQALRDEEGQPGEQ